MPEFDDVAPRRAGGHAGTRVEKLDAFATYVSLTDEKDVAATAFMRTIAQTAPATWTRLSDPAVNVSLLFLGAGRGDFELRVASAIVAARGGDATRVALHANDIADEMRDAFYAHARTRGLESCVADYSVASLDAFTPSTASMDLITASHVLYYVRDWETVVSNVGSALRPEGHAAFAMLSSDSDTTRLRSACMADAGKGAFHGSAEEFASWLDVRRISATRSDAVAHVDARDLFSDDGAVFAPNSRGELLLEFILRRPWSAVGPALRGAVEAIVSEAIAANGGPFLLSRTGFVWLGAPSQTRAVHAFSIDLMRPI